MNVPAKAKPELPPADPLMAGIIKAAADPQTDVEKLERLMALYERRASDNARRAFIAALGDCQADLPTIGKSGSVDLGRGGKGYSYAKWEDICEAIKPILHRHGFALNFKVGADDRHVIVTGTLSHREGHSDEATYPLPFDTSGAKNPVQAMGSSISYGKRYVANALLNLTSRDGIEADDDGRQGPPATSELITQAEITQLQTLIEEAGADHDRFCRYFKIQSLMQFPASRWDDAVALLAKFKKQHQKDADA
jgi:ERF superfamily